MSVHPSDPLRLGSAGAVLVVGLTVLGAGAAVLGPHDAPAPSPARPARVVPFDRTWSDLFLLEGDDDQGLRLRAGGATVTLDDGTRWTVSVDGERFRRAPTPVAAGDATGAEGRPWIVLGDERAFGAGVHDGETFAALAAARVPLRNAGVPAYGVQDALRLGDHLAPEHDPAGFVVVVSAADDAAQWDLPVEARAAVLDGRAVPLRPRAAPPAGAAEGIGAALRAFAAHHAPRPVLVVLLPPPAGRATPLSADTLALGDLPVLDLAGRLGPEHFLPGTDLLSPAGHEVLAEALAARLTP